MFLLLNIGGIVTLMLIYDAQSVLFQLHKKLSRKTYFPIADRIDLAAAAAGRGRALVAYSLHRNCYPHCLKFESSADVALNNRQISK